MSVWADDNDEWCGGGTLACDFGPKPCRSGVCLHYGRCMVREILRAAGQSPSPPTVHPHAPSGETVQQRDEVCAAWCELPDELRITRTTAPTVTVADLDVIDCICMWLATPDGQAYVQAAEAKLTALRRERRLFGEGATECAEGKAK